ncbi:MAG: hypothetical protein HY220_02810 [Candidatus Sungbacteria bacterium]|uniref:Uncharacterized protein n=1 Tax=Candidatus Sungiibacteriota bacterium TaxID=2750080 RepID=A0A9D6QTZ3_9BACT|nr:hypothetical protein [Candidatus Sungbacteria bacterium]
MNVHHSIEKERWEGLSFADQLGNIGSELSRMRSARNLGDYEKAFERALALIDLTRSDRRWRSVSKLKELSRLRETLADAFSGGSAYGSDLQGLDNYLYSFALAARLKK